MADSKGVGKGVLQGVAGLAILFSLASVILYLCATGLTSWSVATEPEGSANGELGLYHFCPNTAIFFRPDVVDFLNITSLPTSCAYVDYNCRIALGTSVETPFGTAYAVRVYDIFDPRPFNFDDRMYELLRAFPGPGSCDSYTTARVFAGIASFAAIIAFLTAPCALAAPARRGSAGGTASTCACCAMICGIVALSLWAASVINWDTSRYGAAYWCILSAVILSAASLPCLATFALAPSADPGYQRPPPNAPPAQYTDQSGHATPPAQQP